MNILKKFKELDVDYKIVIAYLLSLLVTFISCFLGIQNIGDKREKVDENVEHDRYYFEGFSSPSYGTRTQFLSAVEYVDYYETLKYLQENSEEQINSNNPENKEAQSNLIPKDSSKEIYTEQVDLTEMTKKEIEKRIGDLNNLKACMDKLDFNPNSVVYVATVEEILRCQDAIDNQAYKIVYSEEDYNLLAYAIHRELGSNWVPQEQRMRIGCVIMNRVNQGGINKNKDNPTVKDILNEPGQFPYKVNFKNINLNVIEDYCFEAAEAVLTGEYKIPANVVYAATFKQGNGVYAEYYDSVLKNTTYFCFG